MGAVVRDARASLPSADILVIDDGSTDRTADVARAAGAAVLRFGRNRGMCAAVQQGYRFAVAAGYEVAVQVDGDGQHRAVDAAALVAAIQRGEADVVVGSRFLGPGPTGHRSTAARRCGNRLLSRSLGAITGQRVTDATSGLKAAGVRAMRVFAAEYPRDEVESDALLVAWRNGLTVLELPVVMRPRRAGRSTITPVRSAYYGWRAAAGLAAIATGRTALRPQREAA